MPITRNEPVDTVSYLQTVIPPNRLSFLSDLCRQSLRSRPGNVLEVGVYKGGTLLSLALAVSEICPDCKVYAIDTFSGHPYSDNHPVHPVGKYSDVDKQKLEDKLNEAGVLPWIELIEGKVEDIIESLQLPALSFAHIDCDLYLPTRCCAMKVPPRMMDGGILYFDDYGHDHCVGATHAVHDVFSKSRITPVSLPDNTSWSGYVTISRNDRSVLSSLKPALPLI